MGFIVFVTLTIAVIALVLAYKAYTRSGGNIEEMRANINEQLSTEKIRKIAADVLSKAEKSVRGDETQPDTDAPTDDSDEKKAPKK